MGVTALLLTLVGYWVGRYGETTGRGRYAPLLSVGVATILVAMAALLIRFLLGGGGSPEAVLVDALWPTLLFNLLIALPVFVFCRWILSLGNDAQPVREVRLIEVAPPEHGRLCGGCGERSSSRRTSTSDPYRFTPKLALRVGILGLLALAVFAVLLFRLWALQVLSGTHYLAEAQNNQIRTVRIEAPRGTIVDKRGRPLVTNVPGTIVRVWPQDLPKTWARQLGELRRLAGVLDMSPRTIVGLLRGHASDPLTPVTIKSGVHRAQAAYILEHQDEYRGVDVHSTTLRHYPHLALGAHILGHVGEISPEQLKEKPYRRGDYRPGDRIGQGGVEGVYDGYLRGKAGLAQLRVDASGRPRGVFKPRQQPQPGDTLRLTIDLQLQQAAERAIKDGSIWPTRTAATAAGPRTAARSWRSTPATAPSGRLPRIRPTSRACTSVASTSRS